MQRFWRIAVCFGGGGKAVIGLLLASLYLPQQNLIGLAVSLSIAVVGLGALAAQVPRYSSANLRIGVILGNLIIVVPLVVILLLAPQAFTDSVAAGDWATVAFIAVVFLLAVGAIGESVGLIALGRIYQRAVREQRRHRRERRAAQRDTHGQASDPTEAALAAAADSAEPADDVSIDDQVDLDAIDPASDSTIIGEPTSDHVRRGRG